MSSSSSHLPPVSEVLRVESQVQNLPNHYFGVAPEALFTSRTDFLTIMNSLPDLGTWVELGSGLGLGCALYGELFPHRMSIGVELDEARFRWATEHFSQKNVQFLQQDLLTGDLPVGNSYFCYFPTGPALDRILFLLSFMPQDFRLIVIESHGDFIPRLNREAWLEIECELPLASARHYQQVRIYRRKGSRKASFHDFSFQERHLLLNEKSGMRWLGETFGMEWVRDEEFLLSQPPRTIQSFEVEATKFWQDLDPLQAFAIALRRGGEYDFGLKAGLMHGVIRKILVEPVFSLEISSGERLKWEDIRSIRQEHQLCYESSSSHFSLPPAVWASLSPEAKESMPTMCLATTPPKN